MLTQHNIFDNALHILLKQNMDITRRKTANFRSLLELYLTWSSSNKNLKSYRMVHRSTNYLTFKHQCAINVCNELKQT